MSPKDALTAPLLILMAAVLWGTAGTAQAFAPVGATPLAVGLVRLSVGGISMLAVAMLTRSFTPSVAWDPWAVLRSVFSLAAFQPLFFIGLSRTGVAVGTVVAIGSAPIFAGLLGWAVRHERPGGAWLTATVLAIIGCALLLLNPQDVTVDPLGVVSALGAGFAYAAYTVFSKALLLRHKPYAVVAVVFCLSAMFLIPLAAGSDFTWIMTRQGVAVSLHLGLVTASLAYMLFSRGLVYTPSATAVTLTLAEPLTAGMLGVLVLKERITWLTALGIFLLVVGLLVLLRSACREAARIQRVEIDINTEV